MYYLYKKYLGRYFNYNYFSNEKNKFIVFTFYSDAHKICVEAACCQLNIIFFKFSIN